MRRLLAFAMSALPALAAAQAVSLNGSIGTRAALLIIDGQPRTVSVGATVDGVRLLSVADGGADVELGGRRVSLRIGGAPVSVGGGARSAGGSQIVLTAGPGGHFTSGGSINGKAVRFMVDTGATTVAIGQADADRIGLDYRNGTPGMSMTANGAVPTLRVVLSSVRLGDVEIANVQATVLPASMEYVLLGNSFLSRFQMQRDNDVMRLAKRP